MALNKEELQTLIRCGDDTIRLRTKPQRLGLYYIISNGVLQRGWIYCALCDKLLNVMCRKSNNLSRHT